MLWLQDIDCRDFRGIIFKTLGLREKWLQSVDCRWLAAIIFKRFGLGLFLVRNSKLVGAGVGVGSQVSGLSFEFPVFQFPVAGASPISIVASGMGGMCFLF